MSRRAHRCLLLGVAALLAVPLPGRGQQTTAQSATEAELVRTLEELIPLVKPAREEAQRARQDYRAAMDRKVATEELKVGLLRVLVPPGQSEIAEDVVGRVWREEYAAWLDRSPSLDRDRMFFQWSSDREVPRFHAFEVRMVQGSLWRSREYMETGVRQVISESLKGDLVGTRLGSEWALPGIKPIRSPETLAREVMMVPSQAVRDCMEGHDVACLQAMDLRTDDTPLDEWYSPGDRQSLVARQVTRFSGRDPEATNACLHQEDVGACDALLTGYLDEWQRAQDRVWMIPLVGTVRTSLVWYALNQGGAGAWARFVDHADDGALAALEAASGQSGETLVAGWRTWLLEARPAQHAGLGTVGLKALFWMLALFAFATRSTRWRLG